MAGKILLVEDSKTILTAYFAQLRALGFNLPSNTAGASEMQRMNNAADLTPRHLVILSRNGDQAHFTANPEIAAQAAARHHYAAVYLDYNLGLLGTTQLLAAELLLTQKMPLRLLSNDPELQQEKLAVAAGQVTLNAAMASGRVAAMTKYADTLFPEMMKFLEAASNAGPGRPGAGKGVPDRNVLSPA